MKLFVAFLSVLCLCLSGCASGDVTVKPTDDKEAKPTVSSEQKGSLETANIGAQPEKVASKSPPNELNRIVTIKTRYRTVNVRPDPSTRRPPIAKLTGGDKVEVTGEDRGWLKIRFGSENSRAEGWISKKLVED